MEAIWSAIEVAAPIRPMVRIAMYDAEGPPVGFSRNWLVQTVLRRAKRVGWRLYEQFEFTAMTPINQDEMEIYGIDSADKALLRRRVKTEWTHRRAGRTFIWSEGFGKIGLSLEGSSFRGEGDRATAMYMILALGGAVDSAG